jgi:hypothetical protein
MSGCIPLSKDIEILDSIKSDTSSNHHALLCYFLWTRSRDDVWSLHKVNIDRSRWIFFLINFVIDKILSAAQCPSGLRGVIRTCILSYHLCIACVGSNPACVETSFCPCFLASSERRAHLWSLDPFPSQGKGKRGYTRPRPTNRLGLRGTDKRPPQIIPHPVSFVLSCRL